MRRGVENGSRACLAVGPRLVEAGAASLTLHPRSAKQMYTGTADHSLTAELVVARRRAGDRVGRRDLEGARAGRARDDRRLGGDGRPCGAGQPVGAAGDHGRPGRADAEEIVAELLLFMRETVRELGEFRATGLPEEVLRLVPRPRPLPEPVQAGARDAADARRGREAAARGGARSAPCSSGSSPSCPTRSTRSCSMAADLDLRRRLNPGCAPRPGADPAGSVPGSTAVIVAECGAIRSARPPVATIGAVSAPSSGADAVDDRVDLAREAVDAKASIESGPAASTTVGVSVTMRSPVAPSDAVHAMSYVIAAGAVGTAGTGVPLGGVCCWIRGSAAPTTRVHPQHLVAPKRDTRI